MEGLELNGKDEEDDGERAEIADEDEAKEH